MTIARGELTPEQVREYGDALSAHYGEPVMPVSRYCKAFEQWAQAVCDKAKREENDDHRDENLTAIAALVPAISIAIYKSSLLGRLVYGGEPFRTEMCPEHKGRWSGLEFLGRECPHGCQLTGWLPVVTPLPSREEKS